MGDPALRFPRPENSTHCGHEAGRVRTGALPQEIVSDSRLTRCANFATRSGTVPRVSTVRRRSDGMIARLENLPDQE